MNREQNIARFEAELARVQRPGVDKLLDYIRKSDFYTAPASTRFHLSCEGGLLQHSLNVLDALRGILAPIPDKAEYGYYTGGKMVATIPEESVIIIALLHDICKTYFYSTSTRNAKNEKTGRWEKIPYYTIKDRMPLGHGSKSAMIIKQYIELTNQEMYAIWWHMGFTDTSDTASLTAAIEQYPIILAMHTADMMASHFMESEQGNHEAFADPAPQPAGDYVDEPATDGFEEAPPLMEPGV